MILQYILGFLWEFFTHITVTYIFSVYCLFSPPTFLLLIYIWTGYVVYSLALRIDRKAVTLLLFSNSVLAAIELIEINSACIYLASMFGGFMGCFIVQFLSEYPSKVLSVMYFCIGSYLMHMLWESTWSFITVTSGLIGASTIFGFVTKNLNPDVIPDIPFPPPPPEVPTPHVPPPEVLPASPFLTEEKSKLYGLAEQFKEMQKKLAKDQQKRREEMEKQRLLRELSPKLNIWKPEIVKEWIEAANKRINKDFKEAKKKFKDMVKVAKQEEEKEKEEGHPVPAWPTNYDRNYPLFLALYPGENRLKFLPPGVYQPYGPNRTIMVPEVSGYPDFEQGKSDQNKTRIQLIKEEIEQAKKAAKEKKKEARRQLDFDTDDDSSNKSSTMKKKGSKSSKTKKKGSDSKIKRSHTVVDRWDISEDIKNSLEEVEIAGGDDGHKRISMQIDHRSVSVIDENPEAVQKKASTNMTEDKETSSTDSDANYDYIQEVKFMDENGELQYKFERRELPYPLPKSLIKNPDIFANYPKMGRCPLCIMHGTATAEEVTEFFKQEEQYRNDYDSVVRMLDAKVETLNRKLGIKMPKPKTPPKIPPETSQSTFDWLLEALLFRKVLAKNMRDPSDQMKERLFKQLKIWTYEILYELVWLAQVYWKYFQWKMSLPKGKEEEENKEKEAKEEAKKGAKGGTDSSDTSSTGDIINVEKQKAIIRQRRLVKRKSLTSQRKLSQQDIKAMLSDTTESEWWLR